MPRPRVTVAAALAAVLSIVACGLPAPASPTAALPNLPGSTSTPTPPLLPSAAATLVAASPSAPSGGDVTPAPTRSVPEPSDASHFREGEDITLTEIRMVTRTEGWGVAGAYVLKTEDGGQTWREVTPPSPAARPETGKAYGTFLDLQNAWVVFSESDRILPSAVIWNTVDGGSTWSEIEVTQEAFGDLMWAEFFALDPARVWVIFRGVYVGAGTHFIASFLRTTDGGASWESLPSDIGNDYTGFVFADPEYGWLTWQTTGAYAAAPPEYAVTQDGGLSWERATLPLPDDAPNLFEEYEYSESYQPNLLTARVARLLVSSFQYDYHPEGFVSYLYSTEDGGESWETHALPSDVLASDVRMIFFDSETGLILGRQIYRTEDAGRTWEHVKTVSWDGGFTFVDPLHGWAVARSGDAIALVKTINGGATWVELHSLAAR